LVFDQEIETEGFSRRIFTLLRERLRAYHLYEVSYDSSEQSWESVSKKIAALTNEKIPGESLRQIVNPQNKKRGKAPRRTGTKRWIAIRDFLIHPDVGYVHEVELSRVAVPLHPLLALRDFFNVEASSQIRPDQLQPTGIYFSEIETATTVEEIELIIDFDQKTGLSETLQIKVLADLQESEGSWSTRVYEGFTLYSEPGIYLIALRDPLTKAGHMKVVLEADVAQNRETRDDTGIAVEEFMTSFVALENKAWKRINIDNGMSSETLEAEYGVPLDRHSSDILKYIRTESSKLTLDGDE